MGDRVNDARLDLHCRRNIDHRVRLLGWQKDQVNLLLLTGRHFRKVSSYRHADVHRLPGAFDTCRDGDPLLERHKSADVRPLATVTLPCHDGRNHRDLAKRHNCSLPG